MPTTREDSDDALEATYQKWNTRIDDQVAASVKALKDLVSQAEVGVGEAAR